VAAFTSERTYRERYRLGKIASARCAQLSPMASGGPRPTYRCRAALTDADGTGAGIIACARSQQLTEVVTFAPHVGPVGSLVPHLAEQLAALDIVLTLTVA
jgi:hypothetical protein